MLRLSLFLIASMMLATAAAAAKTPEVWIIHLKPQELVHEGAGLEFVKRNSDCIEFFINSIMWRSPEELTALVTMAKTNHMRIGIECGLFDWQNSPESSWTDSTKIVPDTVREKWDDKVGEETARIEIRKIQKLTDAGGAPDYLNLDDSIRRILRPGQDLSRADVQGYDSIDKALDQLISYMKTWRKAYPRIQFFTLSNFPNWGWKGECSYRGAGMFNGDYYEALRKIIARTRAAGIPIAGVTADCPYEYAVGIRSHDQWLKYPDEQQATKQSDPTKVDWMKRLIDLERYTESQHLQFNLILNSETGAMTSDEAACKGTLSYLAAYRKAGGHASRYIVQNWFEHPSKIGPEDETNTYGWLVKQVIKQVTGYRL